MDGSFCGGGDMLQVSMRQAFTRSALLQTAVLVGFAYVIGDRDATPLISRMPRDTETS